MTTKQAAHKKQQKGKKEQEQQHRWTIHNSWGKHMEAEKPIKPMENQLSR